MNSRTKSRAWILSAGALLLVVVTSGAVAQDSAAEWAKKSISLDRTGGFIIGGKHLNTNPAVTNRTLSCDHGYVEYFIPSKPRQTSIVLWHSSSAQVWQNRWDGGEGYKSM